MLVCKYKRAAKQNEKYKRYDEVTSAMHMIASSNLQKAKKNLEETEPYFYTLQIMIAGILGHMQGGIEHQYFMSARR